MKRMMIFRRAATNARGVTTRPFTQPLYATTRIFIPQHYSTTISPPPQQQQQHNTENVTAAANNNQPINDASENMNDPDKIISAEELQRAAQRAQQEIQDRKEMEQLLKTVLWRGARAALLFIVAISAFFIVVKKKGSESRVMRYLQELKEKENAKQLEESDVESEQDKALKEAMEKTEQLKREMNESTWYIKDKKGATNEDIDPEFAKQQQQKLLGDSSTAGRK